MCLRTINPSIPLPLILSAFMDTVFRVLFTLNVNTICVASVIAGMIYEGCVCGWCRRYLEIITPRGSLPLPSSSMSRLIANGLHPESASPAGQLFANASNAHIHGGHFTAIGIVNNTNAVQFRNAKGEISTVLNMYGTYVFLNAFRSF